jgi:hypothetical protein
MLELSSCEFYLAYIVLKNFTWFGGLNWCGESEASEDGNKKRDIDELHFGQSKQCSSRNEAS